MYVTYDTKTNAGCSPRTECLRTHTSAVTGTFAGSVYVFLTLVLLPAISIVTPGRTALGEGVQFEVSSDEQSTIVWHVSHVGIFDCRDDCPECRAYRQRCETYRWSTDVCPAPAQEIVTPEAEPADAGQDGGEIAAPAIEPMGDVADTGQLPRTFGASGDVLSAAPNMIGDFFGSPATGATLSTDRLVASSIDIDEPLPRLSDSHYTASEYPGTIEVHEPGTQGPVAVFTDTGGVFKTSITSAQLLGLLQSDPNAPIPIVNHPDYQIAAETVFGSSNSSGSTVFVPGESFARIPGGAEQPVRPGNTEYFEVFYMYDNVVQIMVPRPGAGATVGRVRIADNNSALPQDRVFVDYNFFKNVPLAPGGVDVNRFVPGLEKTFLNRLGSVELQFPMAVTLDNNIIATGGTQLSNAEMGNVQVTTKVLLTADSRKAIATGLGISVPTADDISVRLADGTDLIRVENQAVHIIPYIAALLTPSDRFFAHAFLELDVDTGGDAVYANPDLSGLRRIGIWNDQTYLFADVGVGGWLLRNDGVGMGLTGLAWTAELHYSKSANDADAIALGNLVVGNPSDDLDLLNGTVGSHLRFGQNLMGTLGYSFPLTSTDRVFDGEFRFFLNRYF